ncbi:MAG: hypothetical protein FWE07_05425 [Turicibacter sp.]|nr:hypothetical protein [Turicibacter sp.]
MIKFILLASSLVFMSPPIINDALTAPYSILAGVVLVSMLGVLVLRKRVFGIKEVPAPELATEG